MCTLNTLMMDLFKRGKKKKTTSVEYWTLYVPNCHSFPYIAKGEKLLDSDAG